MENKTAEGTKECPHCTKEISSRAVRCPYCQADLRTWGWRHPVLTTILLVIVVGIFLNAIGSTSSSPSTSSATNDLHLTIIPLSDGFWITNKEASDWSDCMVGVNGGTGLGFDNPPYKTRTSVTLKAGVAKTVYFSSMSMGDGTVFDPTTHTVNSVVVVCNQGSTDARYWNGTPTSQ